MKRLCFSCLLGMLCWLAILSGCSQENEAKNQDWLAADWGQVEAAAKGTTVRWYMWGGDHKINRWGDTYVAAQLKDRYDITLIRVPMDANVFVNKLLTEKSAGKKDGSIDLLWINGENFKNAKEGNLLFGPYADKLPNFTQYVEQRLVKHDFGYPVNGYETPYGWAQFVFGYDAVRTHEPPRSFAALTKWVKKHPGRFTYPQPPDFTGSAFIRQAFYAVTGGAEQYLKGFDAALFDKQAPKLWAYLNEIKPYLWQEGKAYPKDVGALDSLFERGEVDVTMSYHPLHVQNKILDGAFPSSVLSYVMAEGSIFNLHFTAIPFNAQNKPGAMVTANFLMSPEAQLSKLDPHNWGDFPAIAMDKISQDQRDKFNALDLGASTLSPEKLSASAVPEIPAAYLEKLEKGWDENVLH
ncbi:MAG: ABC transporter substrate-binding protein [Desulfovibrio sp.]|uniref:ABC transporter substrate-binding protein n=1 Tax=Desulfovibrio sp. 7SRBS1 TaxID=3378064 RepID=UPI003B41285F